MSEHHRSGCPINLTLEVVGDKWSLIVLRDMMFGNRRHFRELLTQSEEGAEGLISKADDPSHKQKAIYSLTEMAIELLPVFAAIAAWGRKWLPVSEELSIRAELLETGGPEMWERFMEELRTDHLGVPLSQAAQKRLPVRQELQAAYLEVVARNAAAG